MLDHAAAGGGAVRVVNQKKIRMKLCKSAKTRLKHKIMGIILQFVCALLRFVDVVGVDDCRECWAMTDNKSENPIANRKSEQIYQTIIAALSKYKREYYVVHICKQVDCRSNEL